MTNMIVGIGPTQGVAAWDVDDRVIKGDMLRQVSQS